MSSVCNISAILESQEETKPIFIRKYNFISLLRAMIDGKRKWTSGRYIHEGEKEGEGMIKDLRPLLPNTLGKTFGVNLIENKYRNDSLQVFYKWIKKVPSPYIDTMTNNTINNKCKTYNNFAYIKEYLNKGVPINIAIAEEDQQCFGPLIKQNNLLYMLEIYVQKSKHFKWEFTYHEIEISVVPKLFNKDYIGGLLLPELSKLSKQKNMMYAIVSTEMKYLSENNKFV